MGKLIILSGPSCVGKGPLVKTLEQDYSLSV
jgi:guanylate kinase